MANPSLFGQPAVFTATVAPACGVFDNGGTVQFTVGGINWGTPAPLANGCTSISTSAFPVGRHVIGAIYSGDGNFAGSTAPALSDIIQGSTTTILSASANPATAGQAVTFTAAVTAAEGLFDDHGTVQFAANGTNIGSPQEVVCGIATVSDSPLIAGSYTITATYSGDDDFVGSTATPLDGTVNLAPTSVALFSSHSIVGAGLPLTLTATVTSTAGTPAGSVEFYDLFQGSQADLGSGTSSGGGVWTLPASNLAVGVHSITASYAGNATFAASTSPALSQTVVRLIQVPPKSTTTQLTSSANPCQPGPSCVLTAKVNPPSDDMVNDSVEFYDFYGMSNQQKLGSATPTSNGVATLPVPLGDGTHIITAQYLPSPADPYYAGSTSPPLVQMVGDIIVNKLGGRGPSPRRKNDAAIGSRSSQPGCPERQLRHHRIRLQCDLRRRKPEAVDDRARQRRAP